MIRALSLLLGLALINLSVAQTILFSNATSTPEANIETVDFSDIPDFDVYQGRFYRLLRFNHIPSAEERRGLSVQGIELLEYIPHNTYVASLADGTSAQMLRANGVNWVGELTSEQKVHKWLYQRPFPKYALSAERVKVFIQFHKDVDYLGARRVLLSAGIELGVEYPHAAMVQAAVNIEHLFDVAELPFVAYMDLISEPGEKESLEGQVQHRSNAINTMMGGGLKYDGTGVAIAINDDGAVGPHIDYTGRVDQSDPSLSFFGGTHGDMTAGIAGGGGNLDPTAQGMAPGAFLWIRQYSSSLPNTVTLHTTNGVMAFSSSYSNGCNAGYTSLTRLVDEETFNNPTMIQSFSAGNSNNNDCGYGAGNQWGNVTGGHKIGKNAIAAANLFQDESLVSSSSHGPASDGRIKPDIAAHGQGQLSTDPNNTYSPGGGTSAACPGITGVFAQLVHAHRSLNGGVDAESGLLKACMLNTAHDLGNSGPDFKYGWGRVNALRAYKVLEDGRYLSSTVDQGVSNNHSIVIPAGVEEARVMVYWMDPAASTSASKALVNDLDMVLSQGANSYLPLILNPTPDPALLDLPAVPGVDTLNNVEQVRLINPSAGTYTLNVAGTEVPMGPQRYYVLYEFFSGVQLTYPIGGEGLAPNSTEMIAWDAVGTTGTFDLDYSTDGGSAWTSITTGISGADRQYNWNVPNAPGGDVLVRVTRGAASDQSDEEFSIMEVPTNLQVSAVCPNYMRVVWDPVPGASSYAVHLLGAQYMDSIDVTTATTFDIPIANPIDEQWFAVTAYGPNGMRSRRANAVQFAGNGPTNCPVQHDASIAAVISPAGSYVSCGVLNPQVVVTLANPGLTDESNIPVNYSFNGGATVSETYVPLLPANSSVQYTFTPSITLTGAGDQLVVWTSLPTDLATYNDTLVLDINVIGGTPGAIPILEDFEGQTSCTTSSACDQTICTLSGGWTNMTNGVDDQTDWVVDAGGTPSSNTGPSVDATLGTAAGKYIYIEASAPCSNTEAVLLSPCIDLSGSSVPQLTFSRHMYGNNMGVLHVDLFAAGAWIDDIIPAVSGDQGNQWVQVTVDLSAYVNSTVVVRFRGITGSGYESDIALDDILVAEAPACPSVTNVVATSNPNGTVDVTWNCVSCTGTFVVEYGATGFVPGTGSTVGGGLGLVSSSSNSATISGLPSCQSVDFIVRQDCSTDGFSTNSNAASALVPGVALAPYFQNFDAWVAQNGTISCGGIDGTQDCWFNEAVNTNDWTARSIATGSTATGPNQDYSGSGNYVFIETSGTCSATVGNLLSPGLDVSALSAPELSFAYHMYGATMGTLEVFVSSDGGTTFDSTPAWTLSGDQGNQWSQASVNLQSYAASATGALVIRWRATAGSSFTSDIAIDEVRIDEAPTCPAPTMPAVSTVTGDSAVVSWVCTGCTGTINLEYGPAGFTPGNGTTLTNVNAPYSLTGLQSMTDYEFFVWQDCGGGDVSFNSQSVSFTTAPACGDNFYDDGGANANYSNGQNSVWTFCPSSGERVRLVFNSFDVESSWDAVYIFDGSDTNAPMIASTNGAPSGNNVYGAGGYWGTTAIGPFVSSNPNGCLTVAFTSDGSVSRAGWEANVICEPQSVLLNMTALFQGAYEPDSLLMNDGLRAQGLIPLSEPYSALGFPNVASVSANASVFATTGNDAIVDWVLVELRDASNASTILRSTAALIQRDGDVVDVDGTSLVEIPVLYGDYYVALRHRNHLGAMSAQALSMALDPVVMDMTDGQTQVWGTDAMHTMGNVQVMWMGNAQNDGFLKYTGVGNDRDPILVDVGGSIPTATAIGYFQTDCNLDGVVKYVGIDNDRDPILVNIGGSVPTAVRTEQLP